MTSPLAILDANQFFISVIENYSPIFTSFVFPDQYLKPKGYSEKWPTIFFRNSIPSNVPKHYIAYGNKRIKCLMPYFLFTFHCKWCRNSLRGLLRQTALRDWASGAPGQARARVFAASRACSVVSSPRDCLVRSSLEPGAAREQGSSCLRMLTYVAQDLGDC